MRLARLLMLGARLEIDFQFFYLFQDGSHLASAVSSYACVLCFLLLIPLEEGEELIALVHERCG